MPSYSYIKMSSNKKINEIREKQKISNNIGIGAYYLNNLKAPYNLLKKIKFKSKKEFYISTLYKLLIDAKVITEGREFSYNFTLGTPLQIKRYEKI